MIVGITGLMGSGKDTAADYLIDVHGFTRLSYAGALKDSISSIFGWDREMLEGTTPRSREWREEVDVWWSNRLQMPDLTPRWVLQYWGTEVARRTFHDDIWIASVDNKMRATTDNIVITDCRFKNEFTSIKNAGGFTIRVERGEQPLWLPFARDYNLTSNPQALAELTNFNVHASEYSAIGVEYDYKIDNNGTIDELHKNIERRLF